MTVSIELKLSSKPGTFAKMYVGFSKLGIVPNVISKEEADEDGIQNVVVEFDQSGLAIHSILEQLSSVSTLTVYNITGAQEHESETREVIKLFDADHKEEAAPASKPEKINIFDNHRGRRDKF